MNWQSWAVRWLQFFCLPGQQSAWALAAMFASAMKTTPAFMALKAELTEAVREEVLKAAQL